MSQTPKAEGAYKVLSDGDLADAFAGIKKAASAEEKRLKAVTDELVARGKAQYRGAAFTVVRVDGEQSRFDAKAVAVEMGQPWIDARKKVIQVRTWAVSVNDAPAAVQAPTDPVEPAAKPVRPKRVKAPNRAAPARKVAA